MLLRQVMLQQTGRPDRRAITKVARVLVNDCINQRVNDAACGAWTTTTLLIGKASDNFKRVALIKAGAPVVDTLAGDAQTIRNLFDTVAFIEPEPGLRTSPLPRVVSRS